MYANDSDGYDFEIPEEIKSWIEFQKEKEKNPLKINLGHYILEDGKIKKASLLEWARWFEDINNRRVDYTEISKDHYVSTVFLGIDHNFDPDDNRTILYE